MYIPCENDATHRCIISMCFISCAISAITGKLIKPTSENMDSVKDPLINVPNGIY